jgi:hypothetical protein
MKADDVYFPMRSNIDFFEKKSNQLDLIAKIKQSILLYDNLHFDAGAYTISCGDNGSFDWWYPPDQINTINLDVPETTSTGFYVNMQPEPNGKPFGVINHSDNSKNYVVSFQKLILNMGLIDEKFINFGIHELTPSGKQRLTKAIWNTSNYKDFIEGTTFCKKKILDNFHYSLLCSETIDTPIMIDDLHKKLIEEMNLNIIRAADLRIEVLERINKLLKFNIPDFSLLSMDELLDLRKDRLFNNFREHLLKIHELLINNDNYYENSEIEGLFMKDLMEEAKEFAPSDKKIALNGAVLLLGFLPYIGNATSLASYLKEVNSLQSFQNTSLAFIMKYTK